MSTTKKTVLITGGASGIGLGTVKYLLNKGNYEVISFSRGAGHIKEAKKKLGDRHRKSCSCKVTFPVRQMCRNYTKR